MSHDRRGVGSGESPNIATVQNVLSYWVNVFCVLRFHCESRGLVENGDFVAGIRHAQLSITDEAV